MTASESITATFLSPPTRAHCPSEIFRCLCTAFSEARGHPIERDVYLDGLKEVQRGEKIDTSEIVLTSTNTIEVRMRRNTLKMRATSKQLMGSPGYPMSRRAAANGAPYHPPPQRFGFALPGFRPMPHPPPGLPLIPPPMGPPLYGPMHR